MIHFVISNEYMGDIIKTVKSLEDSEVLIDGVTEVIQYEIKKEEGGFSGALLASFAATVVQTVIFFSGKRYYWKRSHESRKRIL